MVTQNNPEPSKAPTPTAPTMPIRLGHHDGKERVTIAVKDAGGKVRYVGIN